MVDICWTGGPDRGAQDRPRSATSTTSPSPRTTAPGPVGLVAALHASFSQPNTIIQEDGSRFLHRMVQGTRDRAADLRERLCPAHGGAGTRHRTSTRILRAPGPDGAAQRSVKALDSMTKKLVRSYRQDRPGDRFDAWPGQRLCPRAGRCRGQGGAQRHESPKTLDAAVAELKGDGIDADGISFDVGDEAAVIAGFEGIGPARDRHRYRGQQCGASSTASRCSNCPTADWKRGRRCASDRHLRGRARGGSSG